MAFNMSIIKIENDTFDVEIKGEDEDYDNKEKLCGGATFYGKPFGLGNVPDVASLSQNHGLHNAPDSTMARDFEADVKMEKPSMDDDVKPIVASLSQNHVLHNAPNFTTARDFEADVKMEKPSMDDDVKPIVASLCQNHGLHKTPDFTAVRDFEADVKMEKPSRDDDVKQMNLNQFQDMTSFSKLKDRLNDTSDISTQSDLKAVVNVKMEKPCSDDDEKRISLNQTQDMPLSSRQDDTLNYNSSWTRRGSCHEIIDAKGMFECQHYNINSDYKPFIEHTPLSPDKIMQVTCHEDHFKKEPQSSIETSVNTRVNPIVIHSSVDYIVERNFTLENDIAGRPSWSDIPLLKTEARIDDSRNFPKESPGNNESAVTTERLKMEFGEDIDEHLNVHFRQIQESGMNEIRLDLERKDVDEEGSKYWQMERLQSDCGLFLVQDALRKKNERSCWSEERRQRHREQCRLNQQKYRAKKKASNEAQVQVRPKYAIRQLTVTDHEAKKAKHAAYMRQYRANWSVQKRTSVNEKRMQTYFALKSAADVQPQPLNYPLVPFIGSSNHVATSTPVASSIPVATLTHVATSTTVATSIPVVALTPAAALAPPND